MYSQQQKAEPSATGNEIQSEALCVCSLFLCFPPANDLPTIQGENTAKTPTTERSVFLYVRGALTRHSRLQCIVESGLYNSIGEYWECSTSCPLAHVMATADKSPETTTITRINARKAFHPSLTHTRHSVTEGLSCVVFESIHIGIRGTSRPRVLARAASSASSDACVFRYPARYVQRHGGGCCGFVSLNQVIFQAGSSD